MSVLLVGRTSLLLNRPCSTIAGFIQPNVWQLFLSLEHINFVASSPFLHLCPFFPLLFPSVSSSVSRPVPLGMTVASSCTQKLMTHPELNPASPASSFRPLMCAYYADCGFGHVRSNVLIKILVNHWRHLLNT